MDLVTDSEIATFRRDGVVCLRGVMPGDWLARMAVPLEAALRSRATANLSQMADDLARAGATRLVDEQVATSGTPRGRFLAGTDHWCEQPEFLDFALHSPCRPSSPPCSAAHTSGSTRTACW